MLHSKTAVYRFTFVVISVLATLTALAGYSGGRSGADALCDQMRQQHGPNWPCISVPTYTPPPTIDPAPTAPGATTSPNSDGPALGGDAGPGPGNGNGTPIVVPPTPGEAQPKEGTSPPPTEAGRKPAAPTPSLDPIEILERNRHQASDYPSDEVKFTSSTRAGEEIALRRGFYNSDTDEGFGYDKARWKHNIRNEKVIKAILESPDSQFGPNSDLDGLEYRNTVKRRICNNNDCKVVDEVSVVVATSDQYYDEYHGERVNGHLGVKTAYCVGMPRCPDWVSDEWRD